MADWAYSFPLDVLAICLIQYSGDVKGSWTKGMAYTALVIATGLGGTQQATVVVVLLQFTVHPLHAMMLDIRLQLLMWLSGASLSCGKHTCLP